MVFPQTSLTFLKQLVWSGLDPSSVLSRETNSSGVEWDTAIFYIPGVWLLLPSIPTLPPFTIKYNIINYFEIPYSSVTPMRPHTLSDACLDDAVILRKNAR